MEAISEVLDRLYPEGDWPKPFHLVRALLMVRGGQSISDAARQVGTSRKRLTRMVESPDPLGDAFGPNVHEVVPALVERSTANLGQLLVGRAAELAFEDIYHEHVQPTEFNLTDLREGRTSTDYRILNGGGRPLYRINVKFFRPAFRRSIEMVNLATGDCFPLATYKIYQALQKQQEEHLPYIFLIVGVADLAANDISSTIRRTDMEFLARIANAKISGRRNLEDRMLANAVAEKSEAFVAAYERIKQAPWFVLSARRAEQLLKEKLFERVFALRVPGFARQWRNAEVDMHFSTNNDLMKLDEFLERLRVQGPHVMTSMLERGTV